MKEILSENDLDHLDQRIVETERRTNTQIVLAAVKRSDTYAELPWKAFALGSSVAGLAVFAMDLLLYGWTSHLMVLFSVAAMLATGTVFALLTMFIHPFARLFLSAHRAETEVRQYAESFFLSHELFATGERTGILILISLFERHVIILPDTGLRNQLNENNMQHIIKQMSGLLAQAKIARALETGLEVLTRILESSASGRSGGKDELSNEIIEEKGV